MTTRVAAHLLGVAQHAAGAQEPRSAAGERVEPRHRLDVVVEDVGPLGDHARQRHLLAAEVGRQHLDLGVGREAADRADHADERRRAEVGQVVAVDAGDHRVAQPHPLDRLGDAQRLERIVEGRLAGLDVAEAAAAGAGVAEDHERRRAALPAVADVRAGGLLADGVQPLGVHLLAQLAVARAARARDLEPGAACARRNAAHASPNARAPRSPPGLRASGCVTRAPRLQLAARAAARSGDEALAQRRTPRRAEGDRACGSSSSRRRGRPVSRATEVTAAPRHRRHDPVERLEVVVDVDREAVRR